MGKMKKTGARKLKLPTFFESFKDAIIEKMVASLVVLIFVVLAFLLVQAFVRGSDYFKLRSVESIGFPDKETALSVNNEYLRSFKSKNLFNIDINSMARGLAMRYPEAKTAVVSRTLPDKLTIVMDFRKPVAMAGAAKFYPIDNEGYALFTVRVKTPGALPVINGIPVRYDGKPVSRVAEPNLSYALALLKELKRSRILESHKLISINAETARDMAFYIDEGMEVRIGFENIRERLLKLKSTLSDTRLVRDRIKYIDLRFDGVTIGPK